VLIAKKIALSSETATPPFQTAGVVLARQSGKSSTHKSIFTPREQHLADTFVLRIIRTKVADNSNCFTLKMLAYPSISL